MAKVLRLNFVLQAGDAGAFPDLPAFAPYVSDAVAGVDDRLSTGEANALGASFADAGIALTTVPIPFRSFAQFRNDALQAARAAEGRADYLFIVEHGSGLVVRDPAFSDRLTGDAHAVRETSSVVVENPRLIRRTAAAAWRGVTFEFLEVPRTAPVVDGIELRFPQRSAEAAEARRRLDAELLTSALKVEQDAMMRARYAFYLARTLQASGDFAAARRHYLDRAAMGFWQEEVYCSRLAAARCGEALGLPASEILEEYASLYNDMPHRAEALHAIAALCRRNKSWESAYQAAAAALYTEKPAGALFLEDWIYEWGLVDEASIAAYWSGRPVEALQLCDILLATTRLTGKAAERIRANRELAAKAVALDPASA